MKSKSLPAAKRPYQKPTLSIYGNAARLTSNWDNSQNRFDALNSGAAPKATGYE